MCACVLVYACVRLLLDHGGPRRRRGERKGWGIGGADAKNKTRKEIQKGSGVIFMSERIMWLNMREYKEIWKIPEEEEVVLGKFDNDQICRVR